jgi:hypothetical protein
MAVSVVLLSLMDKRTLANVGERWSPLVTVGHRRWSNVNTVLVRCIQFKLIAEPCKTMSYASMIVSVCTYQLRLLKLSSITSSSISSSSTGCAIVVSNSTNSTRRSCTVNISSGTNSSITASAVACSSVQSAVLLLFSLLAQMR